MLFHSKFPEVAIAVGEERLVAIPQLLHDKPETQVIILDDAFQHRSIRPGFTILLTEFNNLYINDWYLPTGDLRDQPSRVKEANVVVVTKCPPDLQWDVASRIMNELQLDPGQKLLFSSIKYGEPYHLLSHAARPLDMETEVLLVTGIANPRPLKQYLHSSAGTYYEMLYADHHIFTIDDWREIVHRFNTIQASRKMILTTEKDAVRLVKFGKEMAQYPLYVLPIEMDWLFGAQDELLPAIHNFIDGFHGNEIRN
jgi:tetraacyldisaccharide 4'-kinase